jgi:hypothetical protein
VWGFQDAEIEHTSALHYTYISCLIWHCFILNWVRATKSLVTAGMIQQGLCRTTSAQQCLPRHTRVTREKLNTARMRSASGYARVTDPFPRETRCQNWYTCQWFTDLAVSRNDCRANSSSATEWKLKGSQNFLV